MSFRLAPAAVVLCLGAGAGGLAACGSTPPSTFYALAAENGGPQPADSAVRTIRLRRPGMAAYLDRPQIVRTVRDYRLAIADTERWASPLDEMFGRVLAQDLEQRLPGTTVFVEGSAISVDADATVAVDVRRFDEGDDGEVHLEAEVAFEKGAAHAPPRTSAVSLKERPADRTTAALVHAMSDAIARLADAIASIVRTQ